MAVNLERQKARGGWVARQVGQHRIQRLEPGRIVAAEHGLAARLVPSGAESAGVVVCAVKNVGGLCGLTGLRHAPAGQHARQCGHISLRVAAPAAISRAAIRHAQGVQFQHLARQVFVQAADARRALAVARRTAGQALHDGRLRPGGLVGVAAGGPCLHGGGPCTLKPQKFGIALDGLDTAGQVLATLGFGRAELRQQPAGVVAAHGLQCGLAQAESGRGQGGGLLCVDGSGDAAAHGRCAMTAVSCSAGEAVCLPCEELCGRLRAPRRRRQTEAARLLPTSRARGHQLRASRKPGRTRHRGRGNSASAGPSWGCLQS